MKGEGGGGEGDKSRDVGGYSTCDSHCCHDIHCSMLVAKSTSVHSRGCGCGLYDM